MLDFKSYHFMNEAEQFCFRNLALHVAHKLIVNGVPVGIRDTERYAKNGMYTVRIPIEINQQAVVFDCFLGPDGDVLVLREDCRFRLKPGINFDRASDDNNISKALLHRIRCLPHF